MKKVYLGTLLFILVIIISSAAYFSYFLWSKTNEKVSVFSSYPSIEFNKTNNFNEFNKYLDSIGFWNTNAVFSTDGKNNVTAKKLTITLVNTLQNGLVLSSNIDPKIAITSFGYTEKSGEVSLYIYFNKDECVKTDCDADKVLNKEILNALYLSTHNSYDYVGLLDLANQAYKNYQNIYLKITYKEDLKWWQKILPGLTSIFKINVYAADCNNWFCGQETVDGSGNPSCGPGGFSESGGDCSAGCPPGYCPKNIVCTCGGGSSGTCDCGSQQCNTTSGCGCYVDGCKVGSSSGAGCAAYSCGGGGGGGSSLACSNLVVIGVTPDDTGVYTLSQGQQYTIAVNYYLPSGSGAYASVFYNTKTCVPVDASTHDNRSSANRVTIGTTANSDLVRGWNYGILYNWTPTTVGNTYKVFCAMKEDGKDQIAGTCPEDLHICVNCQGDNGCQCHWTPETVSGSWINVNVTPACVPSWGTCSASCGQGIQYDGCGGSRACTAPACSPWWQVKDGDITTNGNLNSQLPPTNGVYFDAVGGGGYPGVPLYGGSTSLTQNNVSATGWLVNTTYNSSKSYDSSFILNSIPTGTNITQVPASSVDGTTTFTIGGTTSYGYYWYEYDPTLHGGSDLTITGNMDLGNRKVILIAKGANVNLQGKINLTKGQGFFLLVAGGNIAVDPGVGGTPPQAKPDLEGVYVADNQFITGTAATQLWVRGTVAAYDEGKTGIGVNLGRDLGGSSNLNDPAELFEYAPDLELLYPEKLSIHGMNWQEVAP